jgi:hypothetical protein
MASKESETRVCVIVDNTPRKLFSIIERSNGDLTIPFKVAKDYIDYSDLKASDNSEYNTQKYSVHMSLKSPQNINVLKHTLELRDGREICTRHYTKALKQTNNYAVLFSRRAPDLSLDRYITTSDGHNIFISEANAKESTLYYMIFVCNNNTDIIWPVSDIGVRYLFFSHFRIVILWSFAFVLPFHKGEYSHFITFDKNKCSKQEFNITEYIEHGLPPNKAIDLFCQIRKMHHDNLQATILEQYPELLDITNELFSRPFSIIPMQREMSNDRLDS